MNSCKSVLLVGVGGQGTILTSKIFSTGLLNAGYDVKMSEIHGMAQRGGSVSTQVRYGEKVDSPIIGRGEADILVAFEKMEAMRWIEFLSKSGKLIVNDFEIESATVLSGKEIYPEGINEALREKGNLKLIQASKLALELGNIRVMNIIMLGIMIKELGLEKIDWKAEMEKLIKPRFVEMNKRAFDLGYSL
ncbi:MAG TPA: indolepyruvate oxidoreductase subunit beta [Thermotogota bacterium]|nr:indolepyruvate oxidoreductase subunit beta [Thermotogota bacterium]HPJ90184.1 indolepyruvate oxidoreductase subunit beta [Thermotogota bacterium]HPR95554.1 indolepyruvate oxidoreductase subunit beta [Thermotogota bacterium]